LTGEYLGQTKKKIEEKLNCACGGVLFIDEAYELGKVMYGVEAMTSLVSKKANFLSKVLILSKKFALTEKSVSLFNLF
jgi:hypothetical protein